MQCSRNVCNMWSSVILRIFKEIFFINRLHKSNNSLVISTVNCLIEKSKMSLKWYNLLHWVVQYYCPHFYHEFFFNLILLNQSDGGMRVTRTLGSNVSTSDMHRPSSVVRAFMLIFVFCIMDMFSEIKFDWLIDILTFLNEYICNKYRMLTV